ncbi:type IIL restriction-modification enzyme MmeI, partial [Frateuria defendens]|uniref:type IIL restriction-modification enzyme MmeI n=1 Tax=Frateuria defendens TaxID=2219559 RepID=UPI00066FE57C
DQSIPNSLNQGRQVSLLWPAILSADLEIRFARPSFPWSNLASKKAAVTVSIVGLGRKSAAPKLVFTEHAVQQAAYIGPYLVPDRTTVVSPLRSPLSALSPMTNGSMPNDGGGLLLDADEYYELVRSRPAAAAFCRKFLGSHDSIQGETRYCLWIADADVPGACAIPEIAKRVQHVRVHRQGSGRSGTNALASIPHAFGERRHQEGRALLIPRHSSESRPYLPSILVNDDTVIGDSAIAMYGFTMADVAIYSSRLHLVWIATVCGKIKEDYRYSNSLGWNTFPVPSLTDKNKADLTRCAEDILLAREHHFPATMADLYDPEDMPVDLREAHERNDEVLERIYIGRRFKNDTERLEKLFDLYTTMTASATPAKGKKRKAGANV